MHDAVARHLDALAEWLRLLPSHALALAKALEEGPMPEPARRALEGALHHVVESTPLFHDGLEELGQLEAAVVLRAAAAIAASLGASAAPVRSLGDDVGVVLAVLGPVAPRLDAFVRRLAAPLPGDQGAEPAGTQPLALRVARWAADSVAAPPPSDDKALVKFVAYLEHRLPK